jgi:hypothetical protein
MSEALSLRRKLFLAGKESQAVEKNGHSDDGNFDFARFNDVLEEASRVLEGQGVLIVPELDDVQLRFAKSGDGALATVSMSFEICDSQGDETITKKWSGTGWDDRPGDKAIYVATTGCEKYFLAKLLKIPFGIDPEEDAAATSEADKVRARQDEAAEFPDVGPDLHAIRGSLEDEIPADKVGLG